MKKSLGLLLPCLAALTGCGSGDAAGSPVVAALTTERGNVATLDSGASKGKFWVDYYGYSASYDLPAVASGHRCERWIALPGECLTPPGCSWGLLAEATNEATREPSKEASKFGSEINGNKNGVRGACID